MDSMTAVADRGEHPSYKVNGGTRSGAEYVMLQEWHHYFQSTLRWRNLRKITVAQVHEDVYAAGLMLMWACGHMVAAEDTKFADVVGTRLGMRGIRGSSVPERPKSSCSRVTPSPSTRPIHWGWCRKCFRPISSQSERWSSLAALLSP